MAQRTRVSVRASLVLLIAVAAASSAFAGVPQTGDERFEGLLRAIDTVPTRA
ncbi:MAG: hypothetical protein ACI9MR_003590, partial [Myxococcota bacterium]